MVSPCLPPIIASPANVCLMLSVQDCAISRHDSGSLLPLLGCWHPASFGPCSHMLWGPNGLPPCLAPAKHSKSWKAVC